MTAVSGEECGSLELVARSEGVAPLDGAPGADSHARGFKVFQGVREPSRVER